MNHHLRRAVAVAGAVAVAFLASGCIAIKGELTLDDKARAAGEMSISMSKQVASFLGVSDVDSFESLVTDVIDSIPDGDVSFSETDVDYVMTVSLKNADLDGELWSAEVTDDGLLEFSMANEGLEQGAEDLGDLGLGTEGFGEFDMTINFPGEVREFGGEGAEQVDADTVRWSFPATTTTEISATSEIDDSSGSALGVAIGAIVGVAVLGGLVFFFARRGRQDAAPHEGGSVDEDDRTT